MGFLGRVVGLMILIGIGVAYVMWGSIIGMTADVTEGNVSFWLYDADAARGGTIEGRVRIDNGERVAITGVDIESKLGKQHIAGNRRNWGETISDRGADTAADTLEFSVEVPDLDSPVELAIAVSTVTAVINGMNTFENDRATLHFDRTISTYSPTTSLLRRIGRGALALALAAGAVALLLAGRRWYARRERVPSGAWVLALVPYAAIGYLAFAHLASDASHLHGLLVSVILVGIWLGLLALPDLINPSAGLRRYTITSPMIASSGGDAYRAADVQLIVKPAIDVEATWCGAGFVVMRKKHRFIVTREGWGPAYVDAPASETFGDVPWTIRSNDRTTVMKLLEATTSILGDLVCHNDRELEPVQIKRFA